MQGLLETGDFYRKSGVNALGAASQLEQQRNSANAQLKEQKKAGTMSAIGTGAGIGASIGGPWGAAIGAGVGLLASSILD